MTRAGYAALNTKVRAMAAQSPSPSAEHAAKILPWLPDRTQRAVVLALVGTPPSQRDVTFFLSLQQRMGWLDEKNRRIMLRLLGAEADLRNLTWLYRLKSFFKQTETYGELIPVRHRLHPDLVRRWANLPTAQALQQAVQATPPFTTLCTTHPNFWHTEQALHHALRAHYTTEKRTHPNSLAAVCAALI